MAGDGRLPFRPNLIRALSSLLSVASGASIGREGPITQIWATLASKLGQFAQWPPYRLAVAGGLRRGGRDGGGLQRPDRRRGVCRADRAGQLLDEPVRAADVAPRSSRPSCRGTFFGIDPLVSRFRVRVHPHHPASVVRGAGCAGGRARRSVPAAPAIRGAGRPAARPADPGPADPGRGRRGRPRGRGPGGLGQRLSVASRILRMPRGRLTVSFAGSPAPGQGGRHGGHRRRGHRRRRVHPHLVPRRGAGQHVRADAPPVGLALSLPVGAFALAGMGSVLAATTHSPLLAMIMVFEISLNYSLMPALMLACAVGTLISRRLHANSVYTEPLQPERPPRRRGNRAARRRHAAERSATSCASRCRR